MSYQATGTVGGAIQGAQVGSAFGPVGTAVGFVAGATLGRIAGGQADAAQKAARKASRRQRLMSMRAAWIERRDMIRQGRMAQAAQMAAIASTGEGGFASSAPRGAMASTTAQFGFNQRYFAKRINDYLYIQKQVNKAGKYADRASATQGYMSLASSAANFFAPKPVTSSQLPSLGYGTGEVYGRNATSPIDPSTGYMWEG